MENEIDKTGESIYRRASLSLNEVTFNGNDGIFFEREKDAKKNEETGKFPKEQITQAGESLPVVFLKIRRVLSAFSKKNSMRTSEHNHKGEKVVLYTAAGKQYGTAAELREANPTLKTQQIIYCWLREKDEIVRLVVKGSSLGSDYKHALKTLKFYDYLQDFGSDEHSHEFVTNLVPVKEEGAQGDYYAISFVKGEKLDEEDLAKVKTMIDELHEKVLAIDARMSSNFGKVETEKNQPLTQEELPIIDVADEDDINVEDIPF